MLPASLPECWPLEPFYQPRVPWEKVCAKPSHFQIPHPVEILLQTESGQEMRQRMVNSKLRVGELASTALVALPPVVRVSALAATLRACGHQAFPVTPEVKAALQSGGCTPTLSNALASKSNAPASASAYWCSPQALLLVLSCAESHTVNSVLLEVIVLRASLHC